MENKCRQAIARYNMLSYGDSVIVGLSGGADSCALLHYLCSVRKEYSLHITAVHVNHMIRGSEAERDAAFAEQFCKELGVAFHLYRRDVPASAAEKGIGLEACGREIRYGIFEQEAEKCCGKIATAHTLSDSVETVIFHIVRGCSLNGLKGIPPVRGNIIRPLICCERSDIEAYCEKHSIDYVTDSTNLSADYVRNKIRLQIIPLMREINPSVMEAVGRLSDAACADDGFIGEFSEPAADEFLKTGNSDRLFSSKPPVLSRALMKICADELHITPEQKHVSAMIDAVYRGTGSVSLPGDNLFVVGNQSISFSKKQDASSIAGINNNWSAEFVLGEIITPCGQTINSMLFDKNIYNELCEKNNEKYDEKVFKNCVDYDKIKEAVFRNRRAGDRFSPAGRKCSKSLKKLFNEEKIPPEIRDQLPLLACGGVVAWICGIGVSELFKVTGATRRVLYING